MLLGDSKFNRLKEMPAGYFKNVERTEGDREKLDLKLVPAVFSVGYSNDLLWNDPNLAEGLPVKDSLFVVEAWRGSWRNRRCGWGRRISG